MIKCCNRCIFFLPILCLAVVDIIVDNLFESISVDKTTYNWDSSSIGVLLGAQ